MAAAGLDAEILKHLADNGYPNEPYEGKIKAIGRKGGSVDVEGALIRVMLPKDVHYTLVQKLYTEAE